MMRDILEKLHGAVARGHLTDWVIETKPMYFSVGLLKIVPNDLYDWEVMCDYGDGSRVHYTIKRFEQVAKEDTVLAKRPSDDTEALEVISESIVPLVELYINDTMAHLAENEAFSYGDAEITPEVVDAIRASLPGWIVGVSDPNHVARPTDPATYLRRVAARQARGVSARVPGEFLVAYINHEGSGNAGSLVTTANFTNSGDGWETKYDFRVAGRVALALSQGHTPPVFDHIEEAAEHVHGWYTNNVVPLITDVFGTKDNPLVTESDYYDYGEALPDAATFDQVMAALGTFKYHHGTGKLGVPWRFVKHYGEYYIGGRFTTVMVMVDVYAVNGNLTADANVRGLGIHNNTKKWAESCWFARTGQSDEVLDDLVRWEKDVVRPRLSSYPQHESEYFGYDADFDQESMPEVLDRVIMPEIQRSLAGCAYANRDGFGPKDVGWRIYLSSNYGRAVDFLRREDGWFVFPKDTKGMSPAWFVRARKLNSFTCRHGHESPEDAAAQMIALFRA